MISQLQTTQQLNYDTEVERIIGIFSELDHEEFSSDLLNVIQSSDIVKILDENSAAGPGTLRDVLQVCHQLGKIDASLAWIVGVANSAWSVRSCFSSLCPSIFAMARNKILAMVLGRPAILKWDSLAHHYVLNGEWKYASGSQYASFFFCLASVEGTVTPDIRMVAVPADKLEVIEEWQATGLRGTQSVTVRARNIVIPKSNTEDYVRILSGENRDKKRKLNNKINHASYAGLFTGVLMNCLLGSMLGATEAGLEYVVATADKRPVAGSTYTSMGDSGAIRAEIGRLRSTLDIYKRAAEYNADIIDKAARDPNTILSTQDRVNNRGRATMVMRGCVDIVQDLLWIYGSSGLDKGAYLEKIWRDVNVGARHGGFSKLVPEEAVGLSMLGRDPKDLTRMF